MGHLGRAWERMSHVDQWLQSRARMIGTFSPFLRTPVLASTHNTRDDELRWLS